jgi:hypothetical protein
MVFSGMGYAEQHCGTSLIVGLLDVTRYFTESLDCLRRGAWKWCVIIYAYTP